eukprot:jgi/Psemu1/11786/gm1.11786_g
MRASLSLQHSSPSLLSNVPTSFDQFLQDAPTFLVNAAANTSPSAVSVFLSPETVLAPLNGASEQWVRSLVWTDFRVAVAFFVVAPLFLLSWAVLARFPPPSINAENAEKEDKRSFIAETVLRYMTSYWQASSLLLLTVALNIQESNLGVFAGLFAQAMIVVSLWWWKDLNGELSEVEATAGINKEASDYNKNDEGIILARIFLAWRYVASLAATIGVVIQVPFQNPCGRLESISENPFCAPWLEPPQFASSVISLEPSPTLGALAVGGCALYTLVLAYYAVVLLPSVGRSGRAERPSLMNVVTPIGVWQTLRFLDPPRSKAPK